MGNELIAGMIFQQAEPAKREMFPCPDLKEVEQDHFVRCHL